MADSEETSLRNFVNHGASYRLVHFGNQRISKTKKESRTLMYYFK